MKSNDLHGGTPLSTFALSKQFPFLECQSIATTPMGNSLPLFCIGKGEASILLVAGARATDGISEQILLHFVRLLCECVQSTRACYGVCPSLLLESRCIYILPRLNPDGRQLVLHGADPQSALYRHQMHLNGNSEDFSLWRGNARGVEPSLNFSNDFARRHKECLARGEILCQTGDFPESECESAALSLFVRSVRPEALVEISLGQNGFCFFGTERHQALFSRTLDLPPLASAPSCIPDWFARTAKHPSLFVSIEACTHFATPSLQQTLLLACIHLCTSKKNGNL